MDRDFNGDGIQDVVVTGTADGEEPNFLVWTGKKGVGLGLSYARRIAGSTKLITVGKFDDEKKFACAIGGPDGPETTLFSGGKNLSQFSTVDTGPALTMEFTDLNGDQVSDLLVLGKDGDRVMLFIGAQYGGLYPGGRVTLDIGERLTSVIAADVNGDSRPDIIGTSAKSDSVIVWLADVKGGFHQHARLKVGTNPHHLFSWSKSGERQRDFGVFTGKETPDPQITLLRYTDLAPGTTPGTTNETLPFRATLLPLTGIPGSVLVKDVDGDGKQDLIVDYFTEHIWDYVSDTERGSEGENTYNLEKHRLLLLRGDGLGNLQPTQDQSIEPYGPLVSGDFDGDGRTELVILQSGEMVPLPFVKGQLQIPPAPPKENADDK